MVDAAELDLELVLGQTVAGEGLVDDELVADDSGQHRPRLQVAHAGDAQLADRRRPRRLAPVRSEAETQGKRQRKGEQISAGRGGWGYIVCTVQLLLGGEQ